MCIFLPQILHTCWSWVFYRALTHFHSCSRSLIASFFRPYFSLKLAASRTRAKCAADPGCGGGRTGWLHSGNCIQISEIRSCVLSDESITHSLDYRRWLARLAYFMDIYKALSAVMFLKCTSCSLPINQMQWFVVRVCCSLNMLLINWVSVGGYRCLC